jgi:hypothetical protein
MEELIEVTSPTYGKRLVQEIQRLIACKKYVYLAWTKWRSVGGPLWLEGRMTAEDRIKEVQFCNLYGGDFIEVTMINERKIFIPSDKWQWAFFHPPRFVVADRKVNE